ncbi:hemolysin-type calcium-binding repeat family protein [Microcystis aeruginosa TAIHU98]|uniref:Hemolysin-type calcium-binding repeat family protein n=1 Tax=Microcystis aeruginosa TAIHU98 TaxID=1134457 RepID=L7EDI3_MICAE|nr:calcium-binding protein [Microcystis aeruginosa]ELP56367.1 hemolysin-type calcium-binding repeat family protein [Microcystis aeruginosa TAIHU98]
MVTTISFLPSGSTGVLFSASVSVRAFLEFNPNVAIAISTATVLPSDNLTSVGLINAGGSTVWRITNAGPASLSTTLSRYRGGFSRAFSSLPANSLIFVRGGIGGTYQLSGDIVNTKASSTIVNNIQTFNINESYSITGSAFSDNLTGAEGADTLIGGNGHDILNGSGGNDTIDGGDGNDTLTGGPGADRFAYTASNQGVDTIDDFTTADSDVIQISALGVGFSDGGLTPGTLLITQFLGGAGVVAATDTDQRFLYNTDDGALRFDADGSAGGFAPVQLATLTGAPSITNTQIVIV